MLLEDVYRMESIRWHNLMAEGGRGSGSLGSGSLGSEGILGRALTSKNYSESARRIIGLGVELHN